MKNLFRIAALILVLAQLFVISAAAGEVPASYVEQMKDSCLENPMDGGAW